MEKQKLYYTVKEAAKTLGVSTNTIYKYLEEGSLKGRRLNSRGRFKIPLSEIAPYMTEKEPAKTSEEPKSDKKFGGLAILGIALGVILGMVFVNFLPQVTNVASAESSLVTEIAVATWDYSGRTSTGFGNLVQAGESKLVAGSKEISKFIASKTGSRDPLAGTEEAPVEEVNLEKYVLISVPGGESVNLLEEADPSSKIVAKIETDEVAEKTGEEGGWTKVAINQFPVGWVNTSYTVTSKEAISQVLGAASDELVGKKVIVNETPTGWLRVRAAPGGDEIGKVYPGDIFTLIDKSGDWFLVEISTGQNGWISSQYASIQPED